MSATPPYEGGADGRFREPDGRFSRFSFTAHEDVLRLGVTSVCVVMAGLTNGRTHDELDELLEHALSDLDDAITRGYDLKHDPILVGFRDLHTAVRRSNRDNVASAESLLRMVKMNGSVPRTHLIADIPSLVSLRTRLAIVAHDLDQVDGNVRLALTTGREHFLPAGAQEPRLVPAGEYGYIDDADEVIWRMETKQAAKTRVSLATTVCVYLVQGNPAAGAGEVWQAAAQVVALTKEFCGGRERVVYRS